MTTAIPELLGEVVTWDIKGDGMKLEQVRDALGAAGLEPDACKDMSYRSAFGRACKDLKDDRSIDKLENAGGGMYQFQFTRKHVSGGKFQFDFECILSLDADAGTVTCPENEELAQYAQNLLHEAVDERNAQDVTRLVQRLFKEHADLYPICPRKGVAYFVPEHHREFTTKIDTFLLSLGGGLCRFPVPKGTPEGNKSVKEAVQAGLSTLVEELEAAVDDWDETTRSSTMDKAVERWQKIQYKVDAYSEYLESEQDSLKAKLDAAKLRLANKIAQLKPEDSAAEPVAA